MDLDSLLPETVSLQVDQTLLPARDKFALRVALYALASLRQISQTAGVAIADITPGVIAAWLGHNPQFQESQDAHFGEFFSQLLLSARQTLGEVAATAGGEINALTNQEVIHWFVARAQANIAAQPRDSFAGSGDSPIH